MVWNDLKFPGKLCVLSIFLKFVIFIFVSKVGHYLPETRNFIIVILTLCLIDIVLTLWCLITGNFVKGNVNDFRKIEKS